MKLAKKNTNSIGIKKMTAEEAWLSELLKQNPRFIKGHYEVSDFISVRPYNDVHGAIFKNGALIVGLDVGTSNFKLEELGKIKDISCDHTLHNGVMSVWAAGTKPVDMKIEDVEAFFAKVRDNGNRIGAIKLKKWVKEFRAKAESEKKESERIAALEKDLNKQKKNLRQRKKRAGFVCRKT